ncbi:MAG TPA: P1 family peptidase [Opitutus sp.]|nr:P1 family peptidase [Opitutus sp.]
MNGPFRRQAPRLMIASGDEGRDTMAPIPAARTGQHNTIADIAGLAVGQADDAKVRTGVTVILPDGPAACAVDVRGGGPGTRETDALNAWNLVHTVDAIVLSGGSVYGLAAADGVAAWLGARGRGYQAVPTPGVPRSPIVPSAILFDLANGGDKNWGESPPYRALALSAVASSGDDVRLGTAGAGYGATAGALKGGLGSASLVTADGMSVGAIVAVNCIGSVIVPGTRHFWAGALEIGDEFGGLGAASAHVAGEDWGLAGVNPAALTNTTIACIATDVALDQNELKRVAIMAQDGLARAIRPVHSPFDGDTVFALSTAARQAPKGDRNFAVARIGAVAADTLARAVARGVHAAILPPGMAGQAWRDLR